MLLLLFLRKSTNLGLSEFPHDVIQVKHFLQEYYLYSFPRSVRTKTWWFKTTETNFLISRGQNQGHLLLEALGQNLFLPLPASGGARCPLACDGTTPISAVVCLHMASPFFLLLSQGHLLGLGPIWLLQNDLV